MRRLVASRARRAPQCVPPPTPMSPPMTASILWPTLAHIGWITILYAWLTLARQRAVARGDIQYSCFVLGREEPLAVARITRNLANQFEWPMVFYALTVLLVALGKVTLVDVIAAWVFALGRLA